MEPLAPAILARLTPPDIDVRFFDDRIEAIDFHTPTDLVALSVETYSARRSYEIATAFRRRGVPVVMGGFHPTLAPDDALRHAEAIVVGEVEGVWHRILEDASARRLQPAYRAAQAAEVPWSCPDRTVLGGRSYLPLALVETGRGCRHQCEFCAIHPFFQGGHRKRSPVEVADEIRRSRRRNVFLVDDNITADLDWLRLLCSTLAPLRVRWVSQGGLTAGLDDDLARRLALSGCQGLLVGFESLGPEGLRKMRKPLSGRTSEYDDILHRLRRNGIEIYATFIFGYDGDDPDSFRLAFDFASRHGFYVAAFNHLVPFPGTDLYSRLASEGRLLYDAWWLDSSFRFGMVPFSPLAMTPAELRGRCLAARGRYYTWWSIARRGFHSHRRWSMRLAFWPTNLLMRREVDERNGFPLGDEAWSGPLLPARASSPRTGPGAPRDPGPA